jgi:hypothetical protein
MITWYRLLVASSTKVLDIVAESWSPFEFGLRMGELCASTPKTEQQIDQSHSLISNGSMVKENVVLRIDNVPWCKSLFNKKHRTYWQLTIQDITPSQIRKWLQQPVERIHVLLDYTATIQIFRCHVMEAKSDSTTVRTSDHKTPSPHPVPAL